MFDRLLLRRYIGRPSLLRRLFIMMLLFGLAHSASGAVTELGLKLDVRKELLDNGLTVLMVPDPAAHTASFMTFVNAGSRDELKKGTTGLAHVFEHMMFRGTKKFPSYDEALAPLGPETNASTSKDMTVYFVNVPA
ncbi:MAG: M16 family metallopeptidase, partial [Anaerolineales bacterium]